MVIHGCLDKQDKTFPNSLLIIDKYRSTYLNDLEREGLGMEFLHAINQSLFLFINADHDDHPGAIHSDGFADSGVFNRHHAGCGGGLFGLEALASASCVAECIVQPAVGHGGNLSNPQGLARAAAV